MCICHPDLGPQEVFPEGWVLQPQQGAAPGAGAEGPAGAWWGSLAWTSEAAETQPEWQGERQTARPMKGWWLAAGPTGYKSAPSPGGPLVVGLWMLVLGSGPTTVDVLVVKTQLCYNLFVQVNVYCPMLCGQDAMFTEFTVQLAHDQDLLLFHSPRSW